MLSQFQGRLLRESKTSVEWKDEEKIANNETMAVELKEENAHEVENIDQESDERSKEQISILNEIGDI